MKRIVPIIMALAILACADLAFAAQPATPDNANSNASAMTTPAPEPVSAAIEAPKAAPAPMKSVAAPGEAPMKPEAVPAKASEPTPEWKTATFWIVKVTMPILGVLFVLLVAFGVLKKTWLQWLKEKNAVEIADKVVTQFETYAKGTKASWDDILAQVLKAVVTRVGKLTGDMEVKVRKVVEERKEQAKKKVSGPTTE